MEVLICIWKHPSFLRAELLNALCCSGVCHRGSTEKIQTEPVRAARRTKQRQGWAKRGGDPVEKSSSQSRTIWAH